MASITITLTGTCAQHGGSGAHLRFTVTGDAAATIDAEIANMTQEVSQEDVVAMVRCLVRLGKIGRTNAQLRTLFQNGVTVTV